MNYHEKYNSGQKSKKNYKLHKLFRYATNVLYYVNKSVGMYMSVLSSYNR